MQRVGVAELVVDQAVLYHPGRHGQQDQQVLLQNYFERPAYLHAHSPVDTLGVSGELTVSDTSGSARIFWEQPEGGKVKLHIEVPPK